MEGYVSSLPPGETLGDVVVALCNWAMSSGHAWVVPLLTEQLLASGQRPCDFTEISYAIMDKHDYTDRNRLVRIDSMEVAFEATFPDAPYLTFMERLFLRTQELLNGTLRLPDGTPIDWPRAFGGMASVRFTGRSSALVAMELYGTLGREVVEASVEAVTVTMNRHHQVSAVRFDSEGLKKLNMSVVPAGPEWLQKTVAAAFNRRCRR